MPSKEISRREFVVQAAVAQALRAPPQVAVPIRRVMDRLATCTRDELARFWWGTWPEAVRTFDRGGIHLQCTDATGEIHRSASGRPVFLGVRPGTINLVLTDHIPMNWDEGRALAGITVLHEAYCICPIALKYAHGNRVPFFSLNTCVHELLHVLLQDAFLEHPGWWRSGARESRIDFYATRLWLLHDGAAIRKSASECLERLAQRTAHSMVEISR